MKKLLVMYILALIGIVFIICASLITSIHFKHICYAIGIIAVSIPLIDGSRIKSRIHDD